MRKNRTQILLDKMNHGGKCIIGMVHCLPLPGTLNYSGNIEEIYQRALTDAIHLKEAGVDAVIVENTNDKPYSQKLEVEQIATLSAVTRMVVENVDLPVGVDASFSDGVSAVAIAYAANASFIRSPVFVDSMHLTGVGTVTPCVKELLRYRKLIGAEDIGIWADVQVKHSHLINKDVSIEESAVTACDFGAQAIIATGESTGLETPIETIGRIKKVVSIPVIVGSGFNLDNINQQFEIADGAIVGTAMKKDRKTTSPIDVELAKELMKKVNCINMELLHEKQ